MWGKCTSRNILITRVPLFISDEKASNLILFEQIIRENISKLQVAESEITYKELFPLIRKLGCFTASSPVVAKNIGLTAATPFNENEISSVDINATGLVFAFHYR